jgi:Zn-dependent M28 family amino/carboxypeptidase
MDLEAESLGEVPQFNVIAELRGTELPDEYVLLGAHLDSWHAATGATDNGTGSIMMMEAMRLLKAAYPNPRRTILVGLWGPEEMGLIGSGAFREDHPEVMEGLQAAFNQDNGTWRIERIEGQGLLYAGQHIARWISLVPEEISRHITLEFPGGQNNAGSDHVSFLCAGAPSFRLQSAYDEYRQYTWHTNRDTYDKISFDDLKNNATLAAMLAYAASEDPERMPRDRAILPLDPRTGQPRRWVGCFPPRRSSGGR